MCGKFSSRNQWLDSIILSVQESQREEGLEQEESEPDILDQIHDLTCDALDEE